MKLAKLSPLCCALALASSGAVAMAQDSRSWLGVDLLVNEGSEMKVSDVQVMRVGSLGGGDALPSNPNASYLYDNNRQDFGIQPGVNLAWGRWLDTDKRWGMEFSGLYLMEKKAKWSDSEAGGTGAHTCLIVSFGPRPDLWLGYYGLSPYSTADGYGSIQITSHSRMWGLEASAVHNIVRDDAKAIDMVLGVKHLNLSEDFQISLNNTADIAGDYYRAKDRWETKNSILALKLAARGRVNIGTNWKFTAEGSVALGMNRESVDVSGSGSSSIAASTLAWDNGGVFTGPCNMGRKSRSKLVYIPEVKIGIERKCSERISLTANAHVMYISDVIRPGEQVNRIISPSGTGFSSKGHPDPAAPYPTRRFDTNDYVSYALTLGVKINF